MGIDLALIWAVIILFGVMMYVVMDGFDLGIGILFPLIADAEERDAMVNTVAPVWDGNETWLVLGGTGLLAAFPKGYAILLSALYLPVLMMLIALIFRGVAFEFRFKARRARRFWGGAFAMGSMVAAFAQGLILGALVEGMPLEEGKYLGGAFDWFSPFSMLTGAAVLFGYALLGACWLILKTGGPLQRVARSLTRPLVLVVVGSFAGNYLAIAQIMPPDLNFWLGHQGYEYVDLGRLWQIGKFAGICFWLVLMLRGIVPALRTPGGDKNLLALLTASVGAIGLFYGAGFFYGERTHLTVMEYWRWWIVHLWVEGFFEVFATTALAFIFSTLGLVSRRMATTASLASASLFMLGGIPGTFHHLYFAGTTTPVMAVGASFSALEVVPLIVLGHEAWENWRLKTRAPWMENLKWPLMCFVAVAFWNMLGAGVFGFMINPPVSLYYIQGLNTTPVHAHAALFGVYGFLALGFTLLVLRYIRPQYALSPGLMKLAFWGLNLGLALMIFTSLLPIGLIQFHASVSEGMWYARSEAFMQQDILKTLRWGRTFGDVVFLLGALAMVVQVNLGLLSG